MAQYIGNSPTTVLVQNTEVNDLTSIVTWANVPDANITQSSVTQHQAALSITESQISDLQLYLTSSDLTGYATELYVTTAISGKADTSSLATVATSGLYSDLTGTPTIPTTTGELTNDAGFITSSALTGYATETYVGTAIANLVDAAPTTLDTLNELAAALGDDPNFATSIATAIGAKADTSSLATVATTGDYDDLINTPTIPSLTLQQVDVNGTATESYSNITVLQFDEDSGFDVTNPSAGVAKVAMNSTFKYWEIDGVSALTAVGLDTVNFVSGTGITMSANNTSDPKTFTIGTDLALEQLNNVTLTSATTGQVLKYNGSAWVNGDDEGGATVSGTAPVSPTEGTLWFDNVNTGQLYTYVGTTWLSTAGLTTLEFSSVGDLSDVDITTTAPTNGQALVWNGTNFVPGDVAITETNDLTAAVVWANVPDANITQSSVTQHQAALSITESQISDLQAYLTSETTTTLAFVGTTLTFTNETGIPNNIDLSSLLDEDARAIASGVLDSVTGIVTFTRDDATTFTLDLSALLDDTNLVTSVNGSSGVVILDTDDISEGVTNLYYTDTRVGLYLTTNSYATESYVTTAIAGKADSSSLATVATSGAYSDLTGAPTIPSALTDLGITDGTNGQVLTTDGAGNFTFADTAAAYGDSDVATYLSTNGYATETYVDNAVSTKQDTLVSGTNIKTINGNSVLGSGDLVVTPPEQSIDTTTTTAELMDSFATIDYRSAEYFITTSSTDGFSAFKVLVVHDDTNAYYTTYAVVGNTSSGDVSVSIASNTVNVYFTATNASTQVKFIRTTISGAAIAQMPSSLSTGSGTIDLASDYGTLDLNG